MNVILVLAKIAAPILALGLAASAQAAVTTYTDRSAFEAALDSFSVDNLNSGLPPGSLFTLIDRGDYTIGGEGVWGYGCVTFGCFDNAADGFTYPAYLWNYNSNFGSGGAKTLEFDNAINGFGFDFGEPSSYTPGTVTIGSSTSQTTSGFFGIIDTTAFTTINYDASANFMLTDNFTYGTVAPVPIPRHPFRSHCSVWQALA